MAHLASRFPKLLQCQASGCGAELRKCGCRLLHAGPDGRQHAVLGDMSLAPVIVRPGLPENDIAGLAMLAIAGQQQLWTRRSQRAPRPFDACTRDW